MKPEDLERIVRSVGMDAGLMDMGAASCIYSEGCEGVTMADFQKIADAIEAHVISQRAQGAEVDEAKEREAFEGEMRPRLAPQFKRLARWNDTGDYVMLDVQRAWEGWLARAHHAGQVEESMDMALCEIRSVVIRPGQRYTFSRVGGCEKCAEMEREAIEAYGAPPERPAGRHMLVARNHRDGQVEEAVRRDAERLDWIERENATLECFATPTGAGDADVRWRVITYHMQSPVEREVGDGDTPRAAIDAARAQFPKENRHE